MTSRRRTAFSVVSIVFGLVVGFALFGFIALVLGWFETGEREIHRFHDLGHGASTGIWIGVGALVVAIRPERKIAVMQQIVLAVVAFLLAAALGLAPLALLFGGLFAVVVAILVWLHPARSELLRRGTGPNVSLLILTVVAAVPLVLYALDQTELQRTLPESDPHSEEAHWITMGGLALGLVLLGLLASLRTPGWRIVAWSVSATAVLFGVAAMVFPDYASSPGSGWGAVALAGGIAFLLAAEWEARRRPVELGP